MKGSQGKHDKLVDIVVNELLDKKYDFVRSLVTYRLKDGRNGEMDVYAIKDHYALIFEIKCSNNNKTHKKATYQLEKDALLFNGYRKFKFMVYYDKNRGAHYEWIRNH